MAKNRHLDFDAFRRERRKEPPTIVMYGRQHKLPQDIPAALGLSVIRLRKKFGDLADIPPDEMYELAYDLFGKDLLQEWLDRGLTMPELEHLVMWAVQQYFGGDDDDDDDDADELTEGNSKGRKKQAASG